MPPPPNLAQIDHIVVLMLENRSFDHLLGNVYPQARGGLALTESNLPNPLSGGGTPVTVAQATDYTMPFDPGHEFADVHTQINGPAGAIPGPKMGGFLYSALNPSSGTAPTAANAARVLQYFTPAQLPVVATLASQFAVANAWYSSLPGPTWPNRFFVHAATSGGLTDSPTDADVIRGYSFDSGTIFDRLDDAKIAWRIYHDGLPQTAGIQSLRLQYIDPFTENFRDMSYFQADVAAGKLPPYVFIEPDYDTGNNYLGGNSMHPMNDVRKGEELIKLVYDTIAGSPYWTSTLLIVTFDEHGGFYDHVTPAGAVPTGDDFRYASGTGFQFDQLGVRVPNLLISAYTPANTVLDGLADPLQVFDHSSVLATIESRFGLPSLTARDRAANTLASALSLNAPRVAPSVPAPATTVALAVTPPAALPGSPLSDNQKSFLALATAVRLSLADVSQHAAILANHRAVTTQAQAAAYIGTTEAQVLGRRKQGILPPR